MGQTSDRTDRQKGSDSPHQAGNRALSAGPLARSVRYDDSSKELVLGLTNGTSVRVPINRLQGLAHVSPEAISGVEIAQQGLALHWDDLDVHFTVRGLVQGVYGTKAWMVAIGRKGGAVTSETKQRTSKANGMKGGRPRNVARDQRISTKDLVASSDLVATVAAETGVDRRDVQAVIEAVAKRLRLTQLQLDRMQQ